MSSPIARFEKIVRKAQSVSRTKIEDLKPLHPFDERNVHPEIVKVSKKLFDDGHYPQATFEAFKLLDRRVAAISRIRDTGFKLMMAAFDETKPLIKLTALSNMSEIDEQKGFRHIFAGSATAIRNPRGHEVNLPDPIGMCLDHLALASVLLRRLESRIEPTPAAEQRSAAR
jgi:uncharacterized protein (TIGR02391 family)